MSRPTLRAAIATVRATGAPADLLELVEMAVADHEPQSSRDDCPTCGTTAPCLTWHCAVEELRLWMGSVNQRAAQLHARIDRYERAPASPAYPAAS